MTATRLLLGLVGLGLISLLAFGIVLWTSTDRQQSDLWVELGKGFVQLFLIGVLGAVLKLLGDLYADRRERDADAERVRAERDAEAERFRSDVRRRLVAATNTLRKARILIEANRSVLTWSTQMMEIVGARFDLSALRHELEVSVGARAAPFPDPELVILPIQEMERYLEWLTDDLEHKKDLSELQREAEKKDLTADARAELQRAVWDGLLELDTVADLLETRPSRPRDPRQPSFRGYDAAYRQALDVLTRASLGRPLRPSPTDAPSPVVTAPGAGR